MAAPAVSAAAFALATLAALAFVLAAMRGAHGDRMTG
jgi:hypothetical protein